MNQDAQIHLAAGWLALAIVLVALVELVPSSNHFVVWTLGLVMLYLLLTNTERTTHLLNAGVARLAGKG